MNGGKGCSMVTHDFMNRPIPNLSDLRSNKLLYKNYPICPISDECVRVNDKLLCKSYYWHYDPRPVGAMEDIFLRKRLASKLCQIDKVLYPLGFCLLIQEGYRPLSVQRFVQEVSVIRGLKNENPEISDAELSRKVEMFAASADGDPLSSPPPHLTGGAVDLTIVYSDNGKQVDMGKKGGLYNTAFPDALEQTKLVEFEDAKRFRRLLFWLAREQQIVVNPTEWWHLSWGDQMWAWASKIPSAKYGVVDFF